MRDNYQGGSLGGYIIVAVLLALVLIGGLYGLQRYNASREADSSTEVARENNDENRDNATNDNESTDNADQDRRTQDESEDQSDDNTDTKTESKPTEESENEELPATGPAETAMTALALGALTFAGISYQRSRR